MCKAKPVCKGKGYDVYLCSKYILLHWRCANYLRCEQIHAIQCLYNALTQYAAIMIEKENNGIAPQYSIITTNA